MSANPLSRLIAVLLLAGVSTPAFSDDKPNPETPADFTGIEIGPGILKNIGKPKPIRDWTQPEIDAYYQVLDHAARTDYAAQKKQALANIRAEIARFRKETEAAYQARLKSNAAKADEAGALKTARRNAAAAALRRQRLKLADEYDDDPLESPVFARTTNSLMKDGSQSRFRGRLVTMRGHVRRLVSYDAYPNAFGIKRLHEAWLYTKDSATNPAVVICTKIPEGIPTGDRISEDVTVTGYVLRLHQYRAKSNQGHLAPMILASQIEWTPAKPPRKAPEWLSGGLLALLVLIALSVVYFGRRDKTRHRTSIDRAIQEGEDRPVISPPDETV